MGGRGTGSGFREGGSRPETTTEATATSRRASVGDTITEWEDASIEAIQTAELTRRVDRVPITGRIRKVVHSAAIPNVGSIRIEEIPVPGTGRHTIVVFAEDENGRTIFDARTGARFTNVAQAELAAKEVLADHVSDLAARRRARLDEI